MSCVEMELQGIKKEMEEMESQLSVERALMKFTQDDIDAQVQEYVILKLEIALSKLKEQFDRFSALNEYQSGCDHEFISDLIDIDLDRSKTVVYCKYCHFCK